MENIRKYIRTVINEIFQESNSIKEEELDEERISNPEAAEKVKNKQNFVGSHTYGENLGDLGKMYVAYSYGEQHPLYVWYNDNWYHNMDDYFLENGEVNEWTRKHLKDLRPEPNTKPRSTKWLKKAIDRFKKQNNLGDNNHTDLVPGEK